MRATLGHYAACMSESEHTGGYAAVPPDDRPQFCSTWGGRSHHYVQTHGTRRAFAYVGECEHVHGRSLSELRRLAAQLTARSSIPEHSP